MKTDKKVSDTQWNMHPNKQLEFNTLMLDFYISNDERAMNQFLRDCLDKKIVANFR